MREFSVPPLAEEATDGDLVDTIERNAAEAPDAVVFARRTDGRWQDVTAAAFLAEVRAVAKGLIASGVRPGDRVALMARTRYEWTLTDYAIWAAGAVTVPVYPTSSAEQVQWIISDSGAIACLVENAANEATVAQVRDELPALANVWRIEPDGGTGAVDTLVAAGKEIPDADLAACAEALTAESLATIIYTSGTTGRPKGCMITHGNFVSQATNAVALLDPLFRGGGTTPSTLLFLPLAHSFGRVVQVGCVLARTKLGHSPDVAELLGDLESFRPTFILSVPYVFERVFNRARQKAQSEGRGRIFDAAAAVATAYSEALDQGRIGLWLRVRHAVFDRLVYRKLRAALGGRVGYAISGGAPLGPRLTHFYRGIGLNVLEGYGLTETTATGAVNPPGQMRVGTVGRPAPGCAIRIADDGEVMMKGDPVFPGYWRNEAATAEVFHDGWFATGDLGALDDDGYLTITGRKKDILVTSGGKNVAPESIEDRVRAHALIGQCMVVGDGRPFVAALVTIDPETFPFWKNQNGKPEDATVADLARDPDLVGAVQEAIDAGNATVSRPESVRKFHILSEDFTIESGYLTPSLKLRRSAVAKDFADEIDALYLKKE